MIIIGNSEKENIHCVSSALISIMHLILQLLDKLFLLFIEGGDAKKKMISVCPVPPSEVMCQVID